MGMKLAGGWLLQGLGNPLKSLSWVEFWRLHSWRLGITQTPESRVDGVL